MEDMILVGLKTNLMSTNLRNQALNVFIARNRMNRMEEAQPTDINGGEKVARADMESVCL